MSDYDLIDSFLKDKGFKKLVESDIGKVFKVVVRWRDNEIDFFGERQAKRIKIDETLAMLRNQILQ